MTNNYSNQPLAPVTDRIELLDVIRGFALMGIIYANILSWSGIKYMRFETIEALGNFEMDVMLYRILRFFIDTKFYTIFSLLFGIGFSLQVLKNKDNPSFPAFYSRRLFLLLLIGTVHALIWSGDILMLYSLMGFVVLALRNLSEKQVLRTAIILYLIPLIIDIVYMYSFARDLPVTPAIALKSFPDMTPEEVMAGFESTNFLTVFKTNFHSLLYRWFDFIPSGRPFKVSGLFLLGSFLYSSGYFKDKVYSNKLLIVWVIFGFGLTGIAMAIKGGVSVFSRDWNNILYKFVHEVGQITLALSYISILARLMRAFPRFFFWNVLKAYGRMSLSSYIGHTVLGILVFYPIIGFSYHGKLTLQQIFYVATILLIIQFIFSMLWFRWFKFGPVEWVWRCLTYKKLIPILKEKN